MIAIEKALLASVFIFLQNQKFLRCCCSKLKKNKLAKCMKKESTNQTHDSIWAYSELGCIRVKFQI